MTQMPIGKQAYNVDLVMCIDGTASMLPIISEIKNKALNMPEMVFNSMESISKKLGQFRVKVIVFRDFATDGGSALARSRFFDLNDPMDEDEYRKYVNGINPEGGGDIPENALEAISYAMNDEDWTTEGGRYRRHVIMLFTDAEAKELRDTECMKNPLYPTDCVPANLQELRNRLTGQYPYTSFAQSNARLIVYAPVQDGNTWDKINHWNEEGIKKVFVVPTRPNGGCDDFDIKDAMDVLSGSC